MFSRWWFLVAFACWTMQAVGAESRPPWTSGKVRGSPEPPPMAQVERVFPRLQFKEPVELAFDPTGGRLWVLEVGGRLVSFKPRPETASSDLALDLSKARNPFAQALGLAFHPGFATNRLLYLVYVVRDRDPAGTRLSRFRVESADPPRVDPASEQVLLTWMGGGTTAVRCSSVPTGSSTSPRAMPPRPSRPMC